MTADVAYESSSDDSLPRLNNNPNKSPSIKLIIRKPSTTSVNADENKSIPLSPLTTKPPSRGKPIRKPSTSKATTNALKPPEERNFQDLFPNLELSSALEINIIEKDNSKELNFINLKESESSTPLSLSNSSKLKEHLSLPQVQIQTKEIFDYLNHKLINDEGEHIAEFKLPNKHFLRARESLDQPNLQIEYDMDEEDRKWLNLFMSKKRTSSIDPRYLTAFETLMDHIEKGWFEIQRQKKYENLTIQDIQAKSDACCEICDKNDCENSNCIVFCDGCDLAVHQMCYGVPFIPEGEWLCRKCMVSPSNPVSCLLCPNEGGAFKQTTNNKWAHVLCADWVPETSFVNLDTMEPIANVDQIPKSRWKLLCYICKQKQGAPIQCSIKSCTTAFHATCAREAKFYMKIKLNKYNVLDWKVFCHRHTPMKFKDKVIYDEAQKRLLEKFSTLPKQTKYKRKDSTASKSARAHQQSFSTEEIIVPSSLYKSSLQIIASFNLAQPEWFVTGVCQYWSLKKQRCRGAYLIKRLHLEPWTAKIPTNLGGEQEHQSEHESLLAKRTELERILMLTELIRKRERVKAKLYRSITQYWEAFFVPQKSLLLWAVSKLQRMDNMFLFAEPVTDEIAPLYSTMIKKPMDFSTITNKINSNCYFNIEDFKADVTLIYDNCMAYNDKTTIFHSTAKRHKVRAENVFSTLQERWSALETDPKLGTLTREFDISKLLPFFHSLEQLEPSPTTSPAEKSSSSELSTLTSDAPESLTPPSPRISNSTMNKNSASKTPEKSKISPSTRILRKSTRPPRPNLRSCPEHPPPVKIGKLSKEAQILIKDQNFPNKKTPKK